MTTPNCIHCNDTGRLPGSDYFDCAHCGVAKERVELDEFAEKAGVYELGHVYNDALFAIHRRAVAMGRAAALAELHPHWLAEKERADRAEAELAGLRQPSDLQAAILALEHDCTGGVGSANYIAGFNYARQLAATLVASHAVVPTIPEGWQLVPKEPTVEMIAAFAFKGDAEIAIGHGAIYQEACEEYTEMLAAAPQPAQQEDGSNG